MHVPSPSHTSPPCPIPCHPTMEEEGLVVWSAHCMSLPSSEALPNIVPFLVHFCTQPHSPRDLLLWIVLPLLTHPGPCLLYLAVPLCLAFPSPALPVPGLHWRFCALPHLPATIAFLCATPSCPFYHITPRFAPSCPWDSAGPVPDNIHLFPLHLPIASLLLACVSVWLPPLL